MAAIKLQPLKNLTATKYDMISNNKQGHNNNITNNKNNNNINDNNINNNS